MALLGPLLVEAAFSEAKRCDFLAEAKLASRLSQRYVRFPHLASQPAAGQRASERGPAARSGLERGASRTDGRTHRRTHSPPLRLRRRRAPQPLCVCALASRQAHRLRLEQLRWLRAASAACSWGRKMRASERKREQSRIRLPLALFCRRRGPEKLAADAAAACSSRLALRPLRQLLAASISSASSSRRRRQRQVGVLFLYSLAVGSFD